MSLAEAIPSQTADPSPQIANAPKPGGGERLHTRDFLALVVGLTALAGLLDLAGFVIKKRLTATGFWYVNKYFYWRIPLATMLLFAVPSALTLVIAKLRPLPGTYRLSAWLLCALGVLGAALRFPIHPASSVLLAIGAGSVLALAISSLRKRAPRATRAGLAILGGAVLAAGAVVVPGSLSRDRFAAQAAAAALPAARPGAKNMILIVLDALRARNMSLYGHTRDTTPHLAKWARRGVTFERAISPASWTLPSHISMFTGHWPFEFNTNWDSPLLSGPPTQAEVCRDLGYSTFGIAGNTGYCSYETGLARGFLEFEDYSPAWDHFFGESAIGKRLLEAIYADDDFRRGSLAYQSREAREINRDFLKWLDRRSSAEGRPYFAFINYLDAHEPFVTPRGFGPHFGKVPTTREDHETLIEWRNIDKEAITEDQVALAKDGYDDCIRFLDEQVGRLLDELERRGELEKTVVVITADHGESLGEHDLFNHGSSVYLNEIHVPLIILDGEAIPRGARVKQAVSLRDLPATFFDLAGLGEASRFPGGSLRRAWDGATVTADSHELSPAMSVCREIAEFAVNFGKHGAMKGTLFSLLKDNRHFIRDEEDREALYNLADDSEELKNLAIASGSYAILEDFRNLLLRNLVGLEAIDGGPIEAIEPFLEDDRAQR